MNLYSPIEQIPGIGPTVQKRLKKIGIKTIRDLLFYFPYRYEDFSRIVPIAQIKLGEIVTLKAKILDLKNTRTWKKRMILTEALIQDESSAIKVVWFNQPYLIKILKKGEIYLFSGKINIRENYLYLTNPSYEKFSTFQSIHTGRLVPIYSETEGLSSRWFRSLIKQILTIFKNKIPETLPQEVLKNQKILEINRALWQIHFPDSLKLAGEARRRFAFEEIFLIQLWALLQRIRLKQEKALKFEINLPLIKKLVKSLSFKLTDAQRKSAWQILKDLEKPYPMNRLLEGDVGSGKTLVAAIAALNCASQGGQVAIMVPTEILAKQHFKEFSKLLKDFKISIALLTGQEDKIASKKLKGEVLEISRQRLLEKALSGEIDIIIGTHALIQDKVRFKNLALVIIDEQHRFGVEQRAKLTKSGTIPHLLSMTATPIPRTLALTIYSDLDLSLLNELPKGRKKIITKVVSPTERLEVFNFIREQINQGRQVFFICPLIEKSKKLQVKAATQEYEKLSQEIFSDLKIGLLHGQLRTKEKERVMKNFKAGKIDILVSTSVVEVGIDVPKATVMVIDGAERFGLAQLHQLRGRVGRSDLQSYCFLFTESSSKKTQQRLKALIEAEDGFKLSEKDLELRGPGELSGKRQWGLPDLAMTSLKDLNLIQEAKKEAVMILEKDSQLKKYPQIKERLKNLKERIHLE